MLAGQWPNLQRAIFESKTVGFSRMEFTPEDTTVRVQPLLDTIIDAVYAVEEEAFTAVIVGRLREMGYTVIEPTEED